MHPDNHRRIERRAYALWEAEGQPVGRHEEHWHRAAREIETEDSASVAVRHGPRTASGRRAVSKGEHSTQRRKKAKA
jgi:Protein of unknown function (DUF2934)